MYVGLRCIHDDNPIQYEIVVIAVCYVHIEKCHATAREVIATNFFTRSQCAFVVLVDACLGQIETDYVCYRTWKIKSYSYNMLNTRI